MLRKNRILMLAVIMCLIVIAAGCGTKVKHYEPIEKCLDNKEYEKAPNLVKKARDNESYEQKDRVLYYLDLGLTNHYAQNFKQSNEDLEKAERYMRELYTKSISNKGLSMLTNNNQLPYYGEEHENIYINIFKALNYAHLDKPSEAFVEIRDMYEKISYMEQKYNKKAKKYKNKEVSNKKAKKALMDKKGELKIESNFENSAMGRYFNYAMYMSNEDWDDARISLENMRKSFEEQRDIYNFVSPDSIINPQSNRDKEAIVHSIALLGNGPKKKQNEVRVNLPRLGHVKFVMPELVRRGTNITSVKLFKDGELITQLDKVEDTNNVAQAIFNMKRPIILYKNIFRTVAKEVGGEAASEVAGDQGGDVAEIGVKVATAIYTEISEQADLRTSRLLPGEFRAATFCLPEGQHHLQAKFYAHGNVVQCKDLNIEVSENDLNMIELINFN